MFAQDQACRATYLMSFFDLPPIIERMLLVSDKISDLNFSVGQPPQVGWHHDLSADDTGRVGAAFFDHSRRQLRPNAVIAASRVA